MNKSTRNTRQNSNNDNPSENFLSLIKWNVPQASNNLDNDLSPKKGYLSKPVERAKQITVYDLDLASEVNVQSEINSDDYVCKSGSDVSPGKSFEEKTPEHVNPSTPTARSASKRKRGNQYLQQRYSLRTGVRRNEVFRCYKTTLTNVNAKFDGIFPKTKVLRKRFIESIFNKIKKLNSKLEEESDVVVTSHAFQRVFNQTVKLNDDLMLMFEQNSKEVDSNSQEKRALEVLMGEVSVSFSGLRSHVLQAIASHSPRCKALNYNDELINSGDSADNLSQIGSQVKKRRGRKPHKLITANASQDLSQTSEGSILTPESIDCTKSTSQQPKCKDVTTNHDSNNNEPSPRMALEYDSAGKKCDPDAQLVAGKEVLRMESRLITQSETHETSIDGGTEKRITKSSAHYHSKLDGSAKKSPVKDKKRFKKNNTNKSSQVCLTENLIQAEPIDVQGNITSQQDLLPYPSNIELEDYHSPELIDSESEDVSVISLEEEDNAARPSMSETQTPDCTELNDPPISSSSKQDKVDEQVQAAHPETDNVVVPIDVDKNMVSQQAALPNPTDFTTLEQPKEGEFQFYLITDSKVEENNTTNQLKADPQAINFIVPTSQPEADQILCSENQLSSDNLITRIHEDSRINPERPNSTCFDCDTTIESQQPKKGQSQTYCMRVPRDEDIDIINLIMSDPQDFNYVSPNSLKELIEPSESDLSANNLISRTHGDTRVVSEQPTENLDFFVTVPFSEPDQTLRSENHISSKNSNIDIYEAPTKTNSEKPNLAFSDKITQASSPQAFNFVDPTPKRDQVLPSVRDVSTEGPNPTNFQTTQKPGKKKQPVTIKLSKPGSSSFHRKKSSTSARTQGFPLRGRPTNQVTNLLTKKANHHHETKPEPTASSSTSSNTKPSPIALINNITLVNKKSVNNFEPFNYMFISPPDVNLIEQMLTFEPTQ